MLPDGLHEKGANPGVRLGPECSDKNGNNGIIGVDEAVVCTLPFGASKLVYVVAGIFVPVDHHPFCLIKRIISHVNRMIVTRRVVPIKNKMRSRLVVLSRSLAASKKVRYKLQEVERWGRREVPLTGCQVGRKRQDSRMQADLSDEALGRLAAERPGVRAVKIVAGDDVETAPWVRLKCQFGCDGYAQCLVCPPYTPTPEEMRKVLDSYRRALLLHFEPDMDVKAAVVELEREIFLRGAWKALGLGAGPCYLCERCALQVGGCRHAERARPAMEACGIDVFTTVRKAGLPIEVVRTTRQCPNYYGLILVD
jgi:predicted metal-binding protein